MVRVGINAMGRIGRAYLRIAEAHPETEVVAVNDLMDPRAWPANAALTQASGSFVKVFGWYDNEWGYTSRLVHLTELVGG